MKTNELTNNKVFRTTPFLCLCAGDAFALKENDRLCIKTDVVEGVRSKEIYNALDLASGKHIHIDDSDEVYVIKEEMYFTKILNVPSSFDF